MNTPQNNDNYQPAPKDISGSQAKEIGIEYGDLIIADDISEEQEDRITQILELALVNQEVEFWVSLLTCVRGKDTGLLTKTAEREYDDQKALLREHLGNPNLPPIRGLVSHDIAAKLQEQIGQQSLEQIFSAVENSREHHNNPRHS